MKAFVFMLLTFATFSTLASTHVATILNMQGDVFIYIPGEIKEAGVKHVKYLDKVFHISPAKLGMKIGNGFIVNTGPKSRVKVVYSNGDHLFVSPDSQYKIEWKANEEDPSHISLIRGALRGLIEKKGPRSGVNIQTKSVSFGVRGTDFYVRQGSADDTQISVLRGVIEVKDEKVNKTIEVQNGQTLIVGKNISDLSNSTKKELQIIAQESKLTPNKTVIEDKIVGEELKVLDSKATEVTLQDIKEYQPQVYAEIQNKKLNSDELALNTIEKLAAKAPEKKSKPILNDSQLKDPYDKYYKPKSED